MLRHYAILLLTISRYTSALSGCMALIGLPAMPARISAAIQHGQNKNAHYGSVSEPRPPEQPAEQSQRRSLAPRDISSRPAAPCTSRPVFFRTSPTFQSLPSPAIYTRLTLWYRALRPAACFLLQAICNVHLVSNVLVLGFGRTISPVSRGGRHRPLPHFSS